MNGEPHPVIPSPDPSSMTTAAIERVVEQRNELMAAQLDARDAATVNAQKLFEAQLDGIVRQFEERFTAMDKAASVLATDVTRTPTLLQSAVRTLTELEDVKLTGLKELAVARFESVDQRFIDLKDRTTEDKRVAQEALVAALAAAKELVGKQNEFSAAAIGKSEANTTTTIEQNRQLADANFAGLARQVLDLKDSLSLWRQDMMSSISSVRTEVAQMQTARLTAHDSKTDVKASTTLGVGAIGLLVAVIAVVVTIVATRSTPTTVTDTSTPGAVITLTAQPTR
jgi:hypothetical protein